ncbi:hypothetical protein COU60_05245 [Candidatus Pacearchaeota archaeon CG10_big_fil_rev_8_21_14_0_10_34_76]|nr:MAG: hypothetical protein COU60_05245 [Candidatus Pacearchaeota archaeon CG10_big_fil_rev_8_21_14_0_10_34_76]
MKKIASFGGRPKNAQSVFPKNVPRLSIGAKIAIRKATEARKDTYVASHSIIMGGYNGPEALGARDYVSPELYNPYRDFGMPPSWREWYDKNRNNQ